MTGNQVKTRSKASSCRNDFQPVNHVCYLGHHLRDVFSILLSKRVEAFSKLRAQFVPGKEHVLREKQPGLGERSSVW